ncbi:MAG: enoyl-CoA hydratase-related protein, partial [Acidimicrobiales bacterium]
MSDRVSVSVDGGVADVRLNRPDQLNAFDLGMFSALIDAGEALKADTAVRAVVLSGEGRAFCSGLDFSVFLAMGDEAAGADPEHDLRPLAGRGDGVANNGQRSVHVWRELPVPVIA